MQLNGKSGNGGSAEQIQNRLSWNRYISAFLDDRQRAAIITHPILGEADVSPLSEADRQIYLGKLRSIVGEAASLPKPVGGYIDISFVDFDETISLDRYVFPTSISFHNSRFTGYADFVDSVFFSWADFDDVSFGEGAIFQGTRFNDAARFMRARFSKTANFEAVNFLKGADFDWAVFEGDVAFEDCKFESKTSFQGARFLLEPPRFFGSKLHEGMIWRNVSWPLPKRPDEADSFLEAYERLKLEMDRLKKHEDEILFFSRELQCRRIIYGRVKGLPISIYGFLCNYGLSYIQPLIIMFFVIVYGSILFMFYYGAGGEWKAVGVSLVNTLGIFGFRREMFEASVFNSMPGPLKVFSGLQTIFGSICLFFFGLSLRNRFRIK